MKSHKKTLIQRNRKSCVNRSAGSMDLIQIQQGFGNGQSNLHLFSLTHTTWCIRGAADKSIRSDYTRYRLYGFFCNRHLIHSQYLNNITLILK